MQSERYPLPFGWIKEFDQATGRTFYVDTKATPPRSIWVHPYEDAEYLKAHPDVREKLRIRADSDSDLPPPTFEESQRRHSYEGGRPSTSTPVAGSSKRGSIGALKDQLFGTKEERKAQKLRRKEEERARREAHRQYVEQAQLARQQYYASQPQCGYGSGFGGGAYGGGFGSNQRGRGGGGNFALPLLGGLAGGLLLGEALDGFGDGGFGGGFDGGFDGGFF